MNDEIDYDNIDYDSIDFSKIFGSCSTDKMEEIMNADYMIMRTEDAENLAEFLEIYNYYIEELVKLDAFDFPQSADHLLEEYKKSVAKFKVLGYEVNYDL